MREPSLRVRFENFELDEARNELRRGGERIELQPKPLQLLFYLVRHRDRVVPARELHDEVWPDVIVAPTALSSALREIRQALGDTGTGQRMIQTLRGHGYRFIAEVEDESTDAESDEPPTVVKDAEHRLAALLVADAVGYSRLMAEDEDATVRTFSAYREQIELLLRQHRGRLVDFTGDNFLAEFASALAAVRCAVEIQSVLSMRNASLPSERRVEFRMGIHLGDVRVEGERLFGTGVNVAARLEALAEPGGICVSGTVHEQVRHRADLAFADLGEQSVKNIPEPVHVYGVKSESATAKPRLGSGQRLAAAAVVVVAAAIALAAGIYLRTRPSTSTGSPLMAIAVLPFDDMSPGGDQEWLANGMAEELIESLARIPELRVIARTSAFALRGQDIATVGAKLAVGSVVEGSVRRAGDDLRITAQLIRTTDGTHIWSARYDRKLDDVFAIQTAIATEIAEAIRSEFGIEDAPLWGGLELGRYVPRDVRAYELMRKGVEIGTFALTKDALLEGNAYCRQALAIDPAYADAHAVLAWNHYLLWVFAHDPSDEQRSAARAAARRALELDETNASAHALLARLSIDVGEFEAAEQRLERALQVTPKQGNLRIRYAEVLAETGRVEEALSQARTAASLDPLAPSRHYELGSMYILAGDYEAAIESLEYTLELNPHHPGGGATLSAAYHLTGRDPEALEAAVRYLPEGAKALEAPMRHGFAEGGYEGMTRVVAEQLVALTGSPCGPAPATISILHAMTGDADPMYRCLEEALALGRPTQLYLKAHPRWDPYRDDPRFQALLRRRGLAE